MLETLGIIMASIFILSWYVFIVFGIPILFVILLVYLIKFLYFKCKSIENKKGE